MSQIQVELQETMGNDRSIANSAWTSSTTLEDKTKRTDADVARVVRMLITQKHASPIESVVFRFWIRMPIAIDRQHMTHRIASHNGMSGRYRTMPEDYLNVPEDIKDIIKNNYKKYGDTKYFDNGTEIIDRYYEICDEANSYYQWLMLEFKEAKKTELITNDQYKRVREFFRGVLPQHNMTERVTVMNLRSFANYQKLRNSEYSQKEIRQVAQLMLKCVEDSNICPIAIQTLKECKWEI